MFKNIKTNFKKIACVGLSALMLLASGCKKQIPDFDYAAADLSSYVTLFDTSSYTREMLEGEYKKAMAEKENGDSYIINAGSYFNFYVTAYVKNGDDFEKYNKFCYETYGAPVSDYRVTANAANADFSCWIFAADSYTPKTLFRLQSAKRWFAMRIFPLVKIITAWRTRRYYII